MTQTPGGDRYDWVTFLSDYGLDDVYVGVCKGVLATRASHLRILDICHLVQPQDVRHGARTLAAAIPYLPRAVHLALVDPLRPEPTRGIVVHAPGGLLVGPDNGLLSLAWEVLGGADAAYEVANEELWLSPRSATFRGRDIFAPVAAHLASGGDPADVGPAVPVEQLVTLQFRGAEVDHDHVHGEIVTVDHFGNLSLNLDRTDLEAAGMSLGDTVELRCQGRAHQVPFTLTYGDVGTGRLVLCEDSFRAVMIAVNAGSAGERLRVRRGDPVVVARLAQPAAGAARPERAGS